MNESNNSSTTSSVSKSKNKLLIPVIVGLVVLVGVVVFAFMRRNTATPVNTNLPKEVSVEITNDGFVPTEVEIESGSAVRWTNKTTDEQVSVNSDDHPDHKKHPELNLGEVPKDSTVVHIFNTPGEYTYHDHFHPERTGKVMVR